MAILTPAAATIILAKKGTHFSALEAATEREVIATAAEKLRGATRLIAAHPEGGRLAQTDVRPVTVPGSL